MSVIDRATALELYRVMRTIRGFEERATQLFGENKIWGTIHSYAGEEAIAAGVCAHLRDDDWITSTHRGHGHCIAKGADLGKMFAERLGRETGYCRGRGGSMHIADTSKGNLGANGIVGGGIPIATGAALTAKQLGTDQVAVSFFGDGAANQGSFHESLNLAALWKLPVIFVCEDNKYAISVEKTDSTAIAWNADRASAYGIHGYRVEHNDPLEVFAAAGEAIAHARQSGGPSLIEVKTDRYLGHFQGDAEVYRPKGEVAELRTHDPIPALASLLRQQGVLDNLTDSRIRGRSQAHVADAYAFARASAYPVPAEAFQHVFV